MRHAFEGNRAQSKTSGPHRVNTVVRGHTSGKHGKLIELGGEQAHDAEHGNTAVLELSLPKPVYVKVGREADGVEPDIAGQGAVQPRGLLQEGHSIGWRDLHPRANTFGDCAKKKCVTLRPPESSIHRAWRSAAIFCPHRGWNGASTTPTSGCRHAQKVHHKLRQALTTGTHHNRQCVIPRELAAGRRADGANAEAAATHPAARTTRNMVSLGSISTNSSEEVLANSFLKKVFSSRRCSR